MGSNCFEHWSMQCSYLRSHACFIWDLSSLSYGQTLSHCCCMFNPSTAVQFSAAFKHAAETQSGSPWFNTEELTSLFHSTCQNILDTVAPYKIMPSKPQSELWLNDNTGADRRECRRAEHKRKKRQIAGVFWHFKGQLVQISENCQLFRTTGTNLVFILVLLSCP